MSDARPTRTPTTGHRPGRLNAIREVVRTQLWPVPTIGILIALAVGVLLPKIDAAVDDRLPDQVADYLFGGGAGAARTVLDAIASSLITVTSLTFSLTVVTLQLASGQFSPRLLRTFTSDRFVHNTLALFLGTFVYALTVLRTVRSPDEERTQFVPQISVTVAFVLAVASVVALVLFLAHLAREIRVETMVRSVHRHASAAVRRILGERTEVPADEVLDRPGTGVGLLMATDSGFLVDVDEVGLVRLATEHDVVVLVDQLPGGFCAAGTPVGGFWHVDGRPVAEADTLAVALAACLVEGVERTDAQDFTFGLRQLMDVSAKALSTGVNDPTTAIHALGHTSALLCELAAHRPGSKVLREDGDAGCIRVVLSRPDLPHLLDLAVSEPRRYGASDPTVLARLFLLLREVAWVIREPRDREAVSGQLDRLRRTVSEQDFDDAELAALATLATQVEESLAGTWSFPRSPR